MKDSTKRRRLEMLLRSGELKSPCSKQSTPESIKTTGVFLFPGEEREVATDSGSCYLREMSFPLEEKHGAFSLNVVKECRGADLVLPGKDPSLIKLNPCRAIFLDTETTGLAGGTGTWAFLIGAGWVEQDNFVLRQYFLRHPGEEKAMLLHFSRWAEGFSDMITFNGKTFDLPLIWTRQILSGITPTEPLRHLDLLHSARRLWKERLPSRSLRSLEKEMLGLRRYGDIPGEEIPHVYFSYLRRGETRRLRDIFQHNVLDILSMATLTARVAHTAAGKKLEHPTEYYALGKLNAEKGDMKKAEQYLRLAADCREKELTFNAHLYLARLFKRQGRWKEAVTLWKDLLSREPYDLTVYIELAKYYEHRAGDYCTALALTRRAFARNRNRCSAPSSGELSDPALRRRINRLEKKILVGQVTKGGV